jgi:hypothetical protein
MTDAFSRWLRSERGLEDSAVKVTRQLVEQIIERASGPSAGEISEAIMMMPKRRAAWRAWVHFACFARSEGLHVPVSFPDGMTDDLPVRVFVAVNFFIDTVIDRSPYLFCWRNGTEQETGWVFVLEDDTADYFIPRWVVETLIRFDYPGGTTADDFVVRADTLVRAERTREAILAGTDTWDKTRGRPRTPDPAHSTRRRSLRFP